MRPDENPSDQATKILDDAINTGSSLLAKHALRRCRRIEMELHGLIDLLESQLREKDIETADQVAPEVK